MTLLCTGPDSEETRADVSILKMFGQLTHSVPLVKVHFMWTLELSVEALKLLKVAPLGEQLLI